MDHINNEFSRWESISSLNCAKGGDWDDEEFEDEEWDDEEEEEDEDDEEWDDED